MIKKYRANHYSGKIEAAREALRGRFLADLAHAEHRVSTTKAKLVALDGLEDEQ